jgi:hypothetical protein
MSSRSEYFSGWSRSAGGRSDPGAQGTSFMAAEMVTSVAWGTLVAQIW